MHALSVQLVLDIQSEFVHGLHRQTFWVAVLSLEVNKTCQYRFKEHQVREHVQFGAYLEELVACFCGQGGQRRIAVLVGENM